MEENFVYVSELTECSILVSLQHLPPCPIWNQKTFIPTLLKGIVHRKIIIHSLSTHPHDDGRSGEIL